MFKIWCGLGFAIFLQLVSAQDAVSPAISAAYEASLSALQSCQSPQDVHRMVEAMDTPDWVSVSPSGDKTSRDEAEKQLLGLLAVPVGQRPIPQQAIIYAVESNEHATVVYWVYRMTDPRTGRFDDSGQLEKDTSRLASVNAREDFSRPTTKTAVNCINEDGHEDRS